MLYDICYKLTFSQNGQSKLTRDFLVRGITAPILLCRHQHRCMLYELAALSDTVNALSLASDNINEFYYIDSHQTCNYVIFLEVLTVIV